MNSWTNNRIAFAQKDKKFDIFGWEGVVWSFAGEVDLYQDERLQQLYFEGDDIFDLAGNVLSEFLVGVEGIEALHFLDVGLHIWYCLKWMIDLKISRNSNNLTLIEVDWLSGMAEWVLVFLTHSPELAC